MLRALLLQCMLLSGVIMRYAPNGEIKNRFETSSTGNYMKILSVCLCQFALDGWYWMLSSWYILVMTSNFSQYCVHKSLNQMNPDQTLPLYYFNIIRESTHRISKWSPPIRLCDQNVVYMRATCPRPSWFDRLNYKGTSGSVVGWGTMLQAGKSRVRFPMTSLDFSIDVILLAALWPWGSTQPLTEMSTTNLPRGKGRPARKADNLTAICEPIV
jgi:hypothetical protein